jgi:hypothetical protein
LALKDFGSWTSIYCASPFISWDVLGNCLARAGLWRCVDGGEILFSRGQYLALHVKDGGPRTLRLPRKARSVESLFDGRAIAVGASEFNFDFKPGSTEFFKVDYEAESGTGRKLP